MNHLNKSLLSLAILGAAALNTFPATAQVFEIGDQIQFDLREDRNPELRPSLSTDGNQLNIQLEEQPQPETRFRFGEDGLEIRQEQPAPRERLNLTVPIEADE
ncbi:hypothetical protein IQ265_20015 [Nodosilinea sp. LEGE 06152]|uniref:hypothetical protein n=1 Tax=Nodosilinea sp. LEGE 06152 TaxID=2777966 RepID=UPI001880F8C6|nr:hypothetical protein [Nodosilinea sp. LEGE 06152]MBE9159103.1 hypothetical protein [Nodosilinea sp. LEGE 06152]